MSESSKKASGVGGGYGGRSSQPKAIAFMTGGLLGQDGTGARIETRVNNVAQYIRAETSDTLKRRSVGFRGL